MPKIENRDVKGAYGVLFFVGGLQVLLGAIATIFRIEFLQQYGFGWPQIISGAIYAVLGFLVMRGSFVALIIGIILYIGDSVYILIVGGLMSGNVNFINIGVRIAFIFLLVRAIKPMKMIKQGIDPDARPIEGEPSQTPPDENPPQA